jgi:transcription elongation factor Elf1
MGNYKTNWKLTETVMPKDFNRIEENIKENNKNHNDFKIKYDETLKAQNKKIDGKSEKTDVVLRVPQRLASSIDLNTIKTGGNYVVAESKNAPYNYGRLVVLGWDTNQKWVTQIFYSDMRNEVFTRCSTNTEATSWTPWSKVFSSNNKPTWDDVQGKPTMLKTSLLNIEDFNTAITEGVYRVSGTNIPNAPYSSAIYGNLIVLSYYTIEVTQQFIDHKGRMFARFRNNSNNGTWTSWIEPFSELNKPSWGDVTGKPSTFAPSSHDHDNRYYTESEADNRFLGKTAKANDSERLDGIDSTGFGRAYAPSYHFGGNDNKITTDQFLDILDSLGAFNQTYWVVRGSWAYANNQVINDTNCGDIQLAGCTVEVIGSNRNLCTIRVHTPTTSTMGTENGDFIYVNNGDGYSPGWRRLFNTKKPPSWNDIVNKPSTFAPSTHNHDTVYQPKEATTFTKQETYIAVRTPARKASQYYEFWDKDLGWADIKAGELYANNNRVYHAGNKPTWNDINGKPSTFTPSSHTHDDRYYTESESDNRYAYKTDVLNSSMSEALENNDKQIIDVGFGMIPNPSGEGYVNKDYRRQMKRSLVTIDDVYGETIKRNYKLWDVNLSNMATYKASDVIDILSKPVLNNNQSFYNAKPNQLWIKSASGSLAYVQYKLNVTPNTDYMISFDVEEKNGNSWVAVATTSTGEAEAVLCDIAYADGVTSAIFNTGEFSTIYIRFYSNVGKFVANLEVTYTNAKLIKVKDYCKDNIVLRSLPNGVKDRLKNGKIDRRVGKYTLTGFENWRKIESTKPNTNAFACKLPDSINKPDKSKNCLQCNKFNTVSDSVLATSDIGCMSHGGVGGELIFRVSKGLDTVDDIRNYLNNTETGVEIYYEITPRIVNMDVESKLVDVNNTLIAESGDKLILGTPVIPVATYHKVQLSTQAQIQEVQNQVSDTKKGLWSKIKGLLDCEFSVGYYHSYIKLPSLLGGFVLQWGYEELGSTRYNYIIKEVPFPITFPREIIYANTGYMRSGTPFQDLSGNAVGTGASGREGIQVFIRNTTGQTINGNVSCSWFAVGR